ncbi:Tankyrase-1 [Colletotrichum sp. SAR 10_75]|nr:Tankyrase-1 [Colletotrichum sp. SAR 10_75]
MSLAKLQNLPVEVLLLLVEHATSDGDSDDDSDRDDSDRDDSDRDDSDRDDSDRDDSDRDDSDRDDSTDCGSNGHHYNDNGQARNRQHLFGSLCRVNRRFHSIFEPLLYRAAIATENNVITTLAARDGRLDTLKKAVEYGADLNSVTWVPIPNWSPPGDLDRDLRGTEECPRDTSWGICWATPLHMAVCEGRYDVVKYLLSLGVDVDVPGKLLCGCMSMGEIVAGLDLNWSPELWDGVVIASGVWTPLHYAICRRKSDIARFLISQGASLDTTRYPDRDEIPRDNGIASLFGLDLSKPKKSASIRNRLGTLICSVGTSGSMFDGHEEVVGGDGYGGREPLADSVAAIHTAAVINDQSMIRHLVVDCGFDINAKDGGGATALHYSLTANDIKTVRCVLSLGADPNIDLDIDCHPAVNSAAAWLVSYYSYLVLMTQQDLPPSWVFERAGNRGTRAKFISQALGALLDHGVSCWVGDNASNPKCLALYQAQVDSYWVLRSRKHVYDSCFKRFLEGAMTEYDPAVCCDLKSSVMKLFLYILIWEDFDNTIELFSTIVNVAGVRIIYLKALCRMTPPNLQCLPTEVLLLIVSGVGEKQRRAALAGLSRANKTLHTTCNPFLYHDAIKDNAPEITTLAARHGNLDTLMKAHEYGADLNAVTWVPIPSWTEKGNVISQDWSKIADDDFGYAWATPLAVATCEGHYHVVKYLLTLHVDVDAPGKLFCDCDVPKSILEDAPMDPWDILNTTYLETVCCAGVWTPLHFALCRNKTSIARLLISYGASLTNTRYPVRSQIPRRNGIATLFGLDTVDTPKAAAIRKRLGSLILSLGPREIVQSEDGDTEADDDDSASGAEWIDDAGSTACVIHTAVTTGNEAIVRLLVLDHNVDINQADSKGATVLHYALKTTRVEMI